MSGKKISEQEKKGREMLLIEGKITELRKKFQMVLLIGDRKLTWRKKVREWEKETEKCSLL